MSCRHCFMGVSRLPVLSLNLRLRRSQAGACHEAGTQIPGRIRASLVCKHAGPTCQDLKVLRMRVLRSSSLSDAALARITSRGTQEKERTKRGTAGVL